MYTTLQYLEKLIAFPTVSRDSNLDLIAFVGGELKAIGVASTLVHNAEGTKANLWATIGPAGASGVASRVRARLLPRRNSCCGR